MKNIYMIALFTLREALARKIFIIFFIVSSIVIAGFAIGFALFDYNSYVQIKIGKISEDLILAEILKGIKGMIVGPLFGGGLFLSIFSTAGIISSLLEKGNIDLFLSKPISRIQLILGKFFGGITIVFVNVAYAIVGLWFLIGLKFNSWDLAFLYSIITITFAFALIYTLIILSTILSRSSVLALILSYVVFFLLSPLLAGREFFYNLTNSQTLKTVLDILHYIVPQTSELGRISTQLATQGTISDYEPIWVSVVLLILILSGSISIFNKKDY